MKTLKESIAVQAETGSGRASPAETPPWDLMYQAMLAEIELRVEDAVARALSEHGLAPPPIGGVVINTRKNRHSPAAVLGPAIFHPREGQLSKESVHDGRGSEVFGASALPPWLQPFAHPEKVRFTRTPDALLRPIPSQPPIDHQGAEGQPLEGEPDHPAGAPLDAESLMNAGTPTWRIPVTLPPNVRFNRTPLRKGAEEALTAPSEARLEEKPADRPAAIEDETTLAISFLFHLEPTPSAPEASGPAALAPEAPAAAAQSLDFPGVERSALERAGCDDQPSPAPAPVLAFAPPPSQDLPGAPNWFDFFGAEPEAETSLAAQSASAAKPAAAAEALTLEAGPEAVAAEAQPAPQTPQLDAAAIVFVPSAQRSADMVYAAPQALTQPGLPGEPPLLLLPPPAVKMPIWFDFFGAEHPRPAGEQDNADIGDETPTEASATDLSEPVGVIAAEAHADPGLCIETTGAAALRIDLDAGLAAVEAAGLVFGFEPEPEPEPQLAGEAEAVEMALKPIGIAAPEDLRALAATPRDTPVRKPAASPHGLAPFESTNAITTRTDHWIDPPLDLLVDPPAPSGEVLSSGALEQNARLLEGVLEEFGIRGEIIDVRPGPVVTLYEFEPAPGTKSSRVIGLSDDIARSMSAVSARVAVVQGRNVIGIELPNQVRETVFLSELVSSSDFLATKHKLAIALGKTIGGEPIIVDLARMPHLLVAGTTGSGKSVAINTMILSILYRLRPEECRLIMVDPKMLELSVYEGIPHLLTPVVTDPKKAVVALKWAVREMEDRYKKMSKVGVRNIDGFNARVAEATARDELITRTVQTGYNRETGQPIFETEELVLECLPYIVVVVDEMADLMMVAGKDIEGAIQRLAQMARAAGIHLIMATQRPSVDVITGTIKANFPTRISFQVTSKIDSRTILGEQGAEQLLGQGDMLYMAGGGRISRVHGPFVSDGEVEKVVAHLKTQGHPAYLDVVVAEDDGSDGKAEGPDDKPVFERGAAGSGGSDEDGELYDQAVKVVLRDKKCSTSYIQRRLQVGYNKAASLVERMEKEGIVGQANNAGKREILVYSRDLRYTETKREGEE